MTDTVCKRFAFGLILGSVVFHLAYLVFGCPLDLAPDEAHYWDWSRHLAWSYYSKGPLVAWLIRASCELFGPLSDSLVGSPMLAVRLPALACHAALLAGWYVLTITTLKSHRAALALVGMALTLPTVIASAVLMTIDPPFLACWCWAAVGVWKGLEKKPTPLPTGRGVRLEDNPSPLAAIPLPPKAGEGQKTAGGLAPPSASGKGAGVRSEAAERGVDSGSVRWWLLAAICSTLGVMAKYPMVLLPCGVFGYLLFYRRNELKRPGFWLFVLGSVIGMIPVLVWNAANDWVTFKHVGRQAAGDTLGGIRWLGPFTFMIGQAGFLLGVWFFVWVAAAWNNRRSADPARAFLWWCCVPVWSVFAIASFKASGQINWPATAYITGFVLCVAWVRDQLNGPYRKPVARLVSFGLALGLALSVLAHYPATMRSVFVAVSGPPTDRDPTPSRKYDPTARLRGWRTLAKEVDVIRDRVRQETGKEPLVAGTMWTFPGELGVYCKGHPETYSFGVMMADRHSQYDMWHPNPVNDPQHFLGHSFVFVGYGFPPNAKVFERIEQPTIVVHREEGVPVAIWWVWVGHGFRGFDGPIYGDGTRSY